MLSGSAVAQIAGDAGSVFVRDFVLPASAAATFDVVTPHFTEDGLVEESVARHTVPAGPQQHVHMVKSFAALARARTQQSTGTIGDDGEGAELDHQTQALLTQVQQRSRGSTVLALSATYRTARVNTIARMLEHDGGAPVELVCVHQLVLDAAFESGQSGKPVDLDSETL